MRLFLFRSPRLVHTRSSASPVVLPDASTPVARPVETPPSAELSTARRQPAQKPRITVQFDDEELTEEKIANKTKQTLKYIDKIAKLYDTARRDVVEFAPGPEVLMYTCGITPYDATHMGHAFTYVTFDLVNRVWRDMGLDVHYVQNVTDIDDPLLERALATGDDWIALGDRETQLFREDMTALQVIPPRHYIGAVESIPAVISYVERLKDVGAVYELDGDLYFRVHSDANFGGVSHLSEERMLEIFAERGGDPDRPGKEHPLDCLLWLQERPGEPSWASPFGKGRPGWHIECSAIALDHLGIPIDLQGGGSDLIFPHHEMGAAEAQVATGAAPYARHYTHAAMVRLDGEKMSKSRGNLVFVSRLRNAGVEPAAIRLAILAHH